MYSNMACDKCKAARHQFAVVWTGTRWHLDWYGTVDRWLADIMERHLTKTCQSKATIVTCKATGSILLHASPSQYMQHLYHIIPNNSHPLLPLFLLIILNLHIKPVCKKFEYFIEQGLYYPCFGRYNSMNRPVLPLLREVQLN